MSSLVAIKIDGQEDSSGLQLLRTSIPGLIHTLARNRKSDLNAATALPVLQPTDRRSIAGSSVGIPSDRLQYLSAHDTTVVVW
jgi:hypothetical protein